MLNDDLEVQTWLAGLLDHPGYVKMLEILNEAAEEQAKLIEFSTQPSEIQVLVADWKAFRRIVRLLHTPVEIKENLTRHREATALENHPMYDPLAPPVKLPFSFE